MSAAPEAAALPPLKLDIGCGKNKKEGFLGVDIIDFEGVDIVCDLRDEAWYATRVPDELRPRLHFSGKVDEPGTHRWMLATESVDEVHCSHFLEHLTNLEGRWERVNFFNELYRVLKPGATATLIFPHWCSNRFYGDPTHKEPFGEMGFYYLAREWRMANAPHTDAQHNSNGYSCDFAATWAYTLHPSLQQGRHADYIQNAIQFWKEAAQDIMATLTKPVPK